MRRSTVAGALGFAATAAATLGADTRPEVAVRVTVAAPAFRREFVPPGAATSPELAAAEGEAAKRVMAELNEPPGFLRFGAGGPAAVLELQVVAVAPANAATVLKEIGISVALSGNVASGGTLYWPLRRLGDIRAAPATKEELAAELAAAVAAREDELTREVLSRVPIATTGSLWKVEPWGWVIPFTQQDICIDRGSRFAITNEVAQPFGRQTLDLPAEVFGEFDPPGPTPLDDQRHRIFGGALQHQDLAVLKAAASSSVKAVRVTQYRRLQSSCGRTLPPGEAFR